jgi:hypothetical protein
VTKNRSRHNFDPNTLQSCAQNINFLPKIIFLQNDIFRFFQSKTIAMSGQFYLKIPRITGHPKEEN